MSRLDDFRPDPRLLWNPLNDPGWIYAVKTGNLVKIGKTTDPKTEIAS